MVSRWRRAVWAHHLRHTGQTFTAFPARVAEFTILRVSPLARFVSARTACRPHSQRASHPAEGHEISAASNSPARNLEQVVDGSRVPRLRNERDPDLYLKYDVGVVPSAFLNMEMKALGVL